MGLNNSDHNTYTVITKCKDLHLKSKHGLLVSIGKICECTSWGCTIQMLTFSVTIIMKLYADKYSCWFVVILLYIQWDNVKPCLISCGPGYAWLAMGFTLCDWLSICMTTCLNLGTILVLYCGKRRQSMVHEAKYLWVNKNVHWNMTQYLNYGIWDCACYLFIRCKWSSS